jgi:hypothetical protein
MLELNVSNTNRRSLFDRKIAKDVDLECLEEMLDGFASSFSIIS